MTAREPDRAALGAEPPPEVAIRLIDVVREFGAGNTAGPDRPHVRALDGISLDIRRGERVAVVGPSGSGKSTLLHLIAGIDAPSSGAVWVAGRSLARLDDDALTVHRRDRVGIVFQAFHLLPTLSARENVALPALLAGAAEAATLARADALLEEVELSARRHAPPHTLSGGEMQRVALARALIREPPVLLADEPTGNLDSHAAARVLDMLVDLSRRRGATVVLVTHSREAAAIAQRRVEIRDGRLVGDPGGSGPAAPPGPRP